jgi:hypothetical protein
MAADGDASLSMECGIPPDALSPPYNPADWDQA